VLNLSERQMKQLRKRLERERARRRARLRRKQTRLALEGNEQILKMLGEMELEQVRGQGLARRNALPDLDRYPETGFPRDDPRSSYYLQCKRLNGEVLRWMARFIAAVVKANPGVTWLEAINEIAKHQGVKIKRREANEPPGEWEEMLARARCARG
jgi:hypothetical protein